MNWEPAPPEGLGVRTRAHHDARACEAKLLGRQASADGGDLVFLFKQRVSSLAPLTA